MMQHCTPKILSQIMTTKRKVEIVKLKNGMQMVAVTSTRKTSSDQSHWSKLIQLDFCVIFAGMGICQCQWSRSTSSKSWGLWRSLRYKYTQSYMCSFHMYLASYTQTLVHWLILVNHIRLVQCNHVAMISVSFCITLILGL